MYLIRKFDLVFQYDKDFNCLILCRKKCWMLMLFCKGLTGNITGCFWKQNFEIHTRFIIIFFVEKKQLELNAQNVKITSLDADRRQKEGISNVNGIFRLWREEYLGGGNMINDSME